MAYILACNDTLGTCCSDPALASIINIIKIVIEMVQVIAPVILIVMAAIQLSKMMLNPDDPKGIKKRTLFNKFIAAIIIFLLPLFANLVLRVTQEGVGKSANLEVLACFNSSTGSTKNLSGGGYIQRKTSKSKVKIIEEKHFDKGLTADSSFSISGTTNSSPSVGAFLSSLQRMSNFVKNDRKYRWYYKWDGNSSTFEKANKANNTHLTCVLLPNWALRDIGVLKENQLVYQASPSNTKIYYTHGAKEAIEKRGTIYNFPNTPLSEVKKKIGLKPGDILIWGFGHFNVYAGTNSSGNLMWYDSGRGTDGSWKNGTFYFNSFGPVKGSYRTSKVLGLIRLN